MSSEKMKKQLTPLQALEQMKKFCDYRDRSHSEVKTKLLECGVHGLDLENIIANLIEQGYLNEERYATAFAGGKFRIKHWGRKKIEQQLKAKGVSSYNIKQSVTGIDEAEYYNAMKKLMEKKAATIKDGNSFSFQQKLARFLIGKGYEPDLVWKAVKEFSLS